MPSPARPSSALQPWPGVVTGGAAPTADRPVGSPQRGVRRPGSHHGHAAPEAQAVLDDRPAHEELAQPQDARAYHEAAEAAVAARTQDPEPEAAPAVPRTAAVPSESLDALRDLHARLTSLGAMAGAASKRMAMRQPLTALARAAAPRRPGPTGAQTAAARHAAHPEHALAPGPRRYSFVQCAGTVAPAPRPASGGRRPESASVARDHATRERLVAAAVRRQTVTPADLDHRAPGARPATAPGVPRRTLMDYAELPGATPHSVAELHRRMAATGAPPPSCAGDHTQYAYPDRPRTALPRALPSTATLRPMSAGPGRSPAVYIYRGMLYASPQDDPPPLVPPLKLRRPSSASGRGPTRLPFEADGTAPDVLPAQAHPRPGSARPMSARSARSVGSVASSSPSGRHTPRGEEYEGTHSTIRPAFEPQHHPATPPPQRGPSPPRKASGPPPAAPTQRKQSAVPERGEAVSAAAMAHKAGEDPVSWTPRSAAGLASAARCGLRAPSVEPATQPEEEHAAGGEGDGVSAMWDAMAADAAGGEVRPLYAYVGEDGTYGPQPGPEVGREEVQQLLASPQFVRTVRHAGRLFGRGGAAAAAELHQQCRALGAHNAAGGKGSSLRALRPVSHAARLQRPDVATVTPAPVGGGGLQGGRARQGRTEPRGGVGRGGLATGPRSVEGRPMTMGSVIRRSCTPTSGGPPPDGP